jgi:hypothetical protein
MRPLDPSTIRCKAVQAVMCDAGRIWIFELFDLPPFKRAILPAPCCPLLFVHLALSRGSVHLLRNIIFLPRSFALSDCVAYFFSL